jgi:hypothetical protein
LSSHSSGVDQQPIRGDSIKKLFNNIDFLDRITIEMIVKGIEEDAIVLDDKHHYSLSVIEKYLSKLLGEHAAQLIIARLQSGVQGLKSIAIALMPIATLSLSCRATTCVCAICEFICKCTDAMTMA